MIPCGKSLRYLDRAHDREYGHQVSQFLGNRMLPIRHDHWQEIIGADQAAQRFVSMTTSFPTSRP